MNKAVSGFIVLSMLSCGGAGGGGGVQPPDPAQTCQSNCASAGACSGHGGVDCAAGPDSDGSVICMDGWKGSSVAYQCH